MSDRVGRVRIGFGSSAWRIAVVVVEICGLLAGSNSLEYFTIESNLLVLAYFGVVLVGRRAHPGWSPAPRLRGAITSYILLTGIIYHFVLHDGQDPLPGLFVSDPSAATGNWSQFLLHYVIPLMVLVDWIVWGPRRRVRWIDGLAWAIFPLAYALVMIVRGLVLPGVDDRYPYPFFDPGVAGWAQVWETLARLILIYVVIVIAVIALDRVRGRSGPSESMHSAVSPTPDDVIAVTDSVEGET